MTLNDAKRTRTKRTSRDRIREDLLDELSAWSPRERVGAFRHWLRGSLSLIHLHVLTVLESEGPLSMSKLADALDVSVASVTGIVDRMEERGLVERRRETGDRRIVLVHATDAGDAVFRDLAVERRRTIAPLLDRMTEAELESFLVGLRALRKARAEAMAEAAEAPGGSS